MHVIHPRPSRLRHPLPSSRQCRGGEASGESRSYTSGMKVPLHRASRLQLHNRYLQVFALCQGPAAVQAQAAADFNKREPNLSPGRIIHQLGQLDGREPGGTHNTNLDADISTTPITLQEIFGLVRAQMTCLKKRFWEGDLQTDLRPRIFAKAEASDTRSASRTAPNSSSANLFQCGKASVLRNRG